MRGLSCMREIWGRLTGAAGRAVRFVWERTGTVAAVALLLGTAGMGGYHLMHGDAGERRVAFFAGARDVAGALPPVGVAALEPGNGAAPGVPHVRLESDAAGQVTRLVHVDANGRPQAIPGSGVAEQRVAYDAAGRVIRKGNYSESGLPAEDLDGVAVSEFTYDAAGRLESTVFRNAEGCVCVPGRPGYARRVVSYDSQGRPLEIRHLDAEGKLVTNSRGEQLVLFRYDDEHHSATRRNLVDGAPADNADGVAEQRDERTADGTSLRRSWYNAAGEPVPGAPQQVAAVQYNHGGNGGMERMQLCDCSGGLCVSCRVCAERVSRRDAASRTEWECYNAADGLPCNNPALGYAEHITEYNAAGEPEREYFWNDKGKPCPCYEKRHIRHAGCEYILSLYTDGSSEFRPR